RTARLWDPWTGEPLVNARGMPLGFDAEGKRLAYARDSSAGIWGLVVDDCYRLLRPRWTESPPPEERPPGNVNVAISPGGRLLGAAGLDGVRIWDLASTGEIAHLPLGFSGGVLFHPRDGSLITYGTSGLSRWPIGFVQDGATEVPRIGTPCILE